MSKPILKPMANGHVHPDHVTWDEKTLAEQEKERIENPKMKIDEPPTPFNHYDPEKDEEIKKDGNAGGRSPSAAGQPTALDIQARLVMASGALEDKKVVDGKDDEAQFKAKRKAVYADEGARFKELLKKGAANDEDDED